MRKRNVWALTLAAALAAGMTACGSGGETAGTAAGGSGAEKTADAGKEENGGQIELKLYWWGNQLRNDLTQQVIDLYMSENPNVKITPEFTDWNGYWDKLATSTAGGNMPDIVQMDYRYLEQYSESNSLADLTPYIEDGTLDTSKIPESIIESGSIGGKCYAVSLGSNAPAMYYDKAVVEQAGVTIPEQPTFEELYDLGQKIYEATGALTYFDGGNNMFATVARSYGSHYYDELAAGETKCAEIGMNYVKKFADAEFSISPELLVEKDPNLVETKPIIDGTTWNDFSFSNQYSALAEQAGRELGMCMYPMPEGSEEQPIYLKPSQFFSVAETSPHKEEAVKFVDWFTNSVEANEILKGERGVPVNTEVQEAIQDKVSEIDAQVMEYVAAVGKVATPVDAPDSAGSNEVNTKLNTIVEEVRSGTKDVDSAVAEFAEFGKATLAEAAK